METILLEILEELRQTGRLDDKRLAQIIHHHNRGLTDNGQHCSKARLLPFYLELKELDPKRWAGWGIDPQTETLLLKALQLKPRRSASGVATITVITKPWKCSGECLYCPNDLRMPKSYLHDEPACQRAERNFFDPYLQVASRLNALSQMGHKTDKIELIVLGGSWSDYPSGYQLWFVQGLFQALNESKEERRQGTIARRSLYEEKGQISEPKLIEAAVKDLQDAIEHAGLSYNRAAELLYGNDEAQKEIAANQNASLEELLAAQQANENAAQRMVGLVVETRPDTIHPESLVLLRRLGVTKVQMGIQSLDPEVLKLNKRHISEGQIRRAFELLRIFGFKIHIHFMLNLFGSDPEADKADYLRLVSEKPFLPDEVKLYPCVLTAGTKLADLYAQGTWQPYGEEALVEVLSADLLNTPAFVRVSRMVRDISAHDILAGNRKANLRQLVEEGIEKAGGEIREIRYREISTSELVLEDAALEVLHYETTVSDECFLQWLTPQKQIAGFLRLSLPKPDAIRELSGSLPLGLEEAMIREVHIYGRVSRLHESGEGAQHLGLGRQLIDQAGKIAKGKGYSLLNVISSVGTREYYRSLGFCDKGLYQQKLLD